MATYIIGDLQGCYDELQQLLQQIRYAPESDELWFVGDIVNRGPKSLECLRFVKQLEEQGRAKMVLGNHDFHLLAAYSGLKRFQSKSDTLDDIFAAHDAPQLIDWLRRQPLMVSHPLYEVVMVHAGIPPQWSIRQAQTLAKEVEPHLQGDNWQTFVTEHLFGAEPDTWCDSLQGWDRIRYIVNAFARMRYCNPQGQLEFKLKSAPGEHHSEDTAGFQPWFVHPNRKNKTHEIFFGHWSTLGAMDAYGIHSTDTGCLWGGLLTAYCLETKRRHTLQCTQKCQPKIKKTAKQ
ncbi:MAG: symmetrical bis(5'-nucleosyl)-tetraphosphatase [Gammaproteobacteria bacterium]|nr:symmetrical bis(5'-nucleosyl)-tetraphosphatase [Gammaproteobacteria bacterium]MBD3776343.1 symmetrical bis(5'-nucleosyl)-tetraphosphatase [Thiotrichales bacterium]